MAYLRTGVLLVFAALVPCAALAQSTIFRCADGYTVDAKEAAVKGCKNVSSNPTEGQAPADSGAGDWIQITASDDANISLHRASIRQDGKITKAWSMASFGVPQARPGGLYSSLKRLAYYDCQAGTAAAKESVYFSGKNGTGLIVDRVNLAEQELIGSHALPGSVGEDLQRAVCTGKR